MRFIKFILLMLFFLFFMVFFVQNNDQLGTALQLKFDLFTLQYQSQPIAFYIVVLIFFVAGGLLSTIFFMVDRVRLGAKLGSAESKIRGLESEMASLKASRTTPDTYTPAGETGA
jgi:uncharacterized integral membrane protein